LEITEIIISLIGGFCAGILNALAGFGSIITLAIYMDVLGIPGNLANATNRVNILASSSISAFTFYKNGKLDTSKGGWIIIVTILGAIAGVLLAVNLDADGFKKAFKYFLIPIFLILLLNPKRFILADINSLPTSKWIMAPIFFLFGIYAGFIQVGFGVLFLLVIVIMAKYDLIKGNALKITIVALYTVIVLAIFHSRGMVNWNVGLTLAVGQGLGGYVAARNASRLEGANKWAYRFLVVIVGAVIIHNFELYKLLT